MNVPATPIDESVADLRVVPRRYFGRWLAAAVLLLIAAFIVQAFAKGQIEWKVVGQFMTAQAILAGLANTVVMTFCAMALGIVLGVTFAVMYMSPNPVLKGAAWFYIWFFRGTPLLLQLFFIYYGLPSLGITLSPMTAAVIGLGLNYSAYLGEIIRGAIQSIDHGQMEAAKAIGMSYGQAMRRVIIPQTYKRLMPPVGNEFIALIKDTALVSTIAMVELMRAADQLFNTYFNITALALAAVIYLVLTTIFTFIFEKIEYRAGIYEQR